MWIKWKRRGRKVLPALEDKNLEKNLEEIDKRWLELDRSKKRGQKAFEKVWIVWWTHEKSFFKKHSDWLSISRKLDSIDQKSLLIDLTPIEHRSSQVVCNKKFYRIFDRLSNKFDRSIKNLEKADFWKTEHFNVDNPQNTLFYE